MKRILFSLIFCTFGLAETILIPEDYQTIQAGIDASVDGDTVLVADGDYVENLVLDKSIVLTSYAIYDNLDEWIIFDDYYFSKLNILSNVDDGISKFMDNIYTSNLFKKEPESFTKSFSVVIKPFPRFDVDPKIFDFVFLS